MVEQNGYSADRAVEASDLDEIARSLTTKLAELGVLKPGITEPHVHVKSALEALIKQRGEEIWDIAWKDGNTINRYDERDLGFMGGPGRPVQKRCRRLTLTLVPRRWSPRRA